MSKQINLSCQFCMYEIVPAPEKIRFNLVRRRTDTNGKSGRIGSKQMQRRSVLFLM